MPRTRSLSTLLAIVLSGCAPRSASPGGAVILPRDLAGCYRLLDGLHERFGAETIRLDTAEARTETRVTGGTSPWAAERLDEEGSVIPGDRYWPKFYWEPYAPPDSVRVLFGHGWGGTLLFLSARVRGDTLRGRTVIARDHGPRFEDGGPARLMRIPCVRPQEM